MIRITKPKDAPEILRTQGKKKRRRHCAAYTRSSNDYITGKKSFEIDKKIYAHKTVKVALIQAQHKKCFLCESKVLHISPGDVEHFRPKAAVRQSEDLALEKPGYYWLAYEWSNLFFSCEMRNRIFKKNLFPLRDASQRAMSHRHNIRNEAPIFIHPADENPEDFITFNCWEPVAINDNIRGEATIRMLGLNRSELIEDRRHHFDLLRLVYALAVANPPQPETPDAKILLAKAVEDTAEFAGMIRAAVAKEFSKEGCE